MTDKNFELIAAPSAMIAETVKIVADGAATIVVGKGTEIRDYAVLEAVGGGTITIGDGSIVGYNSWVHGSGDVTIGKDVMIGPSVAVTSSSHRYDLDVPMYEQGLRFAPVVIEDDVWIGANATIAAGSHVGRGSIVAANAVVKGNVPAYVIAAGNPARVVSRRSTRTVLFYTLPLVIRQDPLLFRHIIDRYNRLAKSYEALGWRCVFAGTDELADAQREKAVWRSPKSVGIPYPQGDDWMEVWKAILAGNPVPIHQKYLENLLEDVKPDLIYCWNFDGVLREICNARSVIVAFNELGLSRPPNPVVYYCDPVGVNSTASMRTFWQRYQHMALADKVKTDIALRTEHILPNYTLDDERRKELVHRLAPRSGAYALVLLQVSDDSNIVVGSRFKSMQEYVDYCVTELGEYIDIVVKPHPAEPFQLANRRHGVEIAAVDDTTCELIAAADAVVTINSSAGFEAAMAGKAVYTLGNAPYCGLGITIDVPSAGLAAAWRRHGTATPADTTRLDRVADFAYHHYFLHEDAFFDAGEHLCRIAEWQDSAEPLGPSKPYVKGLEMDRYLAQIRDLRGKCERYEEWIETLQKTADQVESVSGWATGLKAALDAAQAEIAGYQRALEDAREDAVVLRGHVREMHEGGVANLPVDSLKREVLRLNAKIDEIYASRSWKISAPLRFLGRMARHPNTSGVRRIHAVVRQRGGYADFLKQAIDYCRRNGITGLIRRLRQGPGSRAAVEAPLVSRPEHLIDLPPPTISDVIVFGVIDWNFRFQRPQQLSLGFAKRGHRVFYVSSELIVSSEPGFSVVQIEGQTKVYQIHFHVAGLQNIYASPAPERARTQLLKGLAMLLSWMGAKDYLSIVHHPFWLPLARAMPCNKLVYDCMDHHEGFGDSVPEMISAERALMAEADALIVTSGWLYNIARERNANVSVVRNACDFPHFSVVPERIYQDPEGRKVIGYYGAIAEWFDIDLVAKVAQAFPDHLILLVGADTCGAREHLKPCRNVRFTGEVPYRDLPLYLYCFDICLLPFRVVDLTLATNPVKVYEYLCSGKTVVSVALPELKQFGDLVLTAKDHDEFLNKCRIALDGIDPDVQEKRIAFASQQTWEHRARELEEALERATRPLVSIVVVTYNNLDLTKKCLSSIERYTTGVDYEVIIVDNASQDGSPDFLREYASTRSFVRLILNEDNRGFAAANNQGLAMGDGDYLVVLNNDTVVTEGWALGLIRHLRRDNTIGLIGPVTNNIGNEAKIPIEYANLDDMHGEARKYTTKHLGQSFDINTLAFFCVMLPRQTYMRVGGLDEAFGLGFFEDDDYCRRVQQQGLKCVCADDVFVHHNLSASFNKLGDERKRKLMETNRKIYEAKWGAWVPHQYRQPSDMTSHNS